MKKRIALSFIIANHVPPQPGTQVLIPHRGSFLYCNYFIVNVILFLCFLFMKRVFQLFSELVSCIRIYQFHILFLVFGFAFSVIFVFFISIRFRYITAKGGSGASCLSLVKFNWQQNFKWRHILPMRENRIFLQYFACRVKSFYSLLLFNSMHNWNQITISLAFNKDYNLHLPYLKGRLLT